MFCTLLLHNYTTPFCETVRVNKCMFGALQAHPGRSMGTVVMRGVDTNGVKARA